MIKTAHQNILESSAVTLASGSEDSAFPLGRLYDRGLSMLFKSTLAETLDVVVDQGDSPLQADTLIIAPGHNLEGVTLSLMHSDDGIGYTEAVAPWVAGTGTIEVSWLPLVKRYWKFTVNSPTEIPAIGEMFITSAYEWQRMPERPVHALEGVPNITRAETSAGAARMLVHGPLRRRRVYSVPRCPQDMAARMLELWDSWGQGRPFWLLDHEGQWMYVSVAGEMDLTEEASGYWSFKLDFMEVLA